MENNDLLISILVPTYNRVRYLKECLDSIVIQKGFNKNDLELIVSDNSEGDETKDFMEEYGRNHTHVHIMYNKNKENLGMVGNRNKLLEIKKGEYFILLSDDDKFYDENSLKTLYDGIRHHDTDICYGIRQYIDGEGRINTDLSDMNLSFLKHRKYCYITFKMQLIDHSIWFGGILYKSYNILFLKNVEVTADYDFNLRYLQAHNKCVLINNKTFLYRMHGNQLSKTISLKKAIHLYVIMLNNLKIHRRMRLILIIKFIAGNIYWRLTGNIGYKILFFVKNTIYKL